MSRATAVVLFAGILAAGDAYIYVEKLPGNLIEACDCVPHVLRPVAASSIIAAVPYHPPRRPSAGREFARQVAVDYFL